MLETDEVDDDFFTPVANTSLANIFGNVSKNKDSHDNNSLKYVPAKPQSIVPKKTEQAKTSECVFACALIGHEWCNNVYTSRGKLGFAIVKIQKTGEHNIVLYDSNKTTLSCTLVSTNLVVTVKNNSYISYYDSLQKYWSIYGTEEETKKITEILKSLGASVNYSTYSDKGPLEPNNSEVETNTTLEESAQINKDSDTDSSINRKTKASILNRMANMGHSVLPTRTVPAERISDTDTDEVETHPKAVRHKTPKSSLKRNSVESISSETRQVTEAHQRIIVSKPEPENKIAMYNSQLLPLSNTNMLSNSSNEFNMFMSEQRINNSELRINLNRITDKVDAVLDKINNFENKDSNTNVSSHILQKLLTEYENKIKIYEELLKSRGIDDKKIIENSYCNNHEEIEILNNKISEIEKKNEDKCNEVCALQKEITVLKEKHSQESQNYAIREKELIVKVNSLEDCLRMKNEELIHLTKDKFTSTDHSHDNIGDKVKNIMNDTFQTIATNFEDSSDYPGETIKRIIGTVIKKITIHTLSELKQN